MKFSNSNGLRYLPNTLTIFRDVDGVIFPALYHMAVPNRLRSKAPAGQEYDPHGYPRKVDRPVAVLAKGPGELKAEFLERVRRYVDRKNEAAEVPSLRDMTDPAHMQYVYGLSTTITDDAAEVVS